MSFKGLVRRIPPIANRDATIKELKAENRKLRQRRPNRARSHADDRPADTTTYGSLEHQVRIVQASGLFDPAWYQEQLAETSATDLLEHYLTEGFRAGLSPHPCFDTVGYAAEPGVPRLSVAAPLLHYLLVGARAKLSPHPGFRPANYAKEYPDSIRHPGGPIAHFIVGGHTAPDSAVVTASAATASSSLTAPATFLEAAAAVARNIRSARGHEHLPRETKHFDHDAAALLKANLRADDTLLAGNPQISIVLPTKDRANVVSTAVASVMAQTYPHWELLVIDDGSTDNTLDVLADFQSDKRIRVIQHENNRGVAAARNTGLAAATGEYVAYIDSDNTWESDFLETLLRAARRESAAVVYGASALVEQRESGKRRYRGMGFSRAALRERNYIDCIVVLHEHRLLTEVGGFDETLRRNVDWDFLIRLANAAEFRYVPVIATQYDLWESGTGRITTDELASSRYVVRQRTLIDWAEAHEAPRKEDMTSLVLVAHTDADATVATVRRALATADRPLEVIVVDSKLGEIDAVRLQFQLWNLPEVRVRRLTQELPMEVARNVGAADARGEFVVLFTENMWTEAGWLVPLVEALVEHAVIAPVLLEPGGTVWAAGVQRIRGVGALMFRGLPGDAPEIRSTRQVSGVASVCLATRAVDFLAVKGFDPLSVQDYGTSDLSLRISTQTGRSVAVSGRSPVTLLSLPLPQTRGSRMVTAIDNERRFARTHREITDPDPAEFRVAAWERGDDGRLGAVLAHARPDRPLRWAIKIGAPDVYRRARWGDWHFAMALRDSLERQGHEVAIDCRDAWYRPTSHLDDVVLVLRGRGPYRVNPAHINVAWVISHPDEVSPAELGDFDLVFGASRRWCLAVANRTETPVLPLLQCTDHRRFAPGPPDPERSHKVLVVANARGMRPVVGAALAGGIIPTVYGHYWKGLLPTGAWRDRNVPNNELPAVYRGAGVVLNDHWEDMRRDGLLSNRLFDLAACEARMVSDYLPEIEQEFGDAVPTFRDPAHLPTLIQRVLEDSPERQEARRQLGEMVRREHTFDARARTLSDHVLALRSGDHA